MGTKYTTNTLSGYNSAPPSDDGSTASTNQVTWAKTVSKIGNPLKTLAEAVNTALVTALSTTCRSVTSNDSTTAADHWRTVQIAATVTALITVTLADAATMANGYIVTVANQSAVTCSITRATASDTIATVTTAVSILALESITFCVNAAGNGYLILARNGSSAALTNASASGSFTFAAASEIFLSATAAASLGIGAPMANGYITASAAANALTIAVKAVGANDPSATDPVALVIRNGTAADGSSVGYVITSALSVVLSSGSTLGCASAETVRIHVGIMQNATTGVELFAWTAAVGTSASIFRPDIGGFVTTTAEGGAGAADTAQTLYSTTVRTSQPWRYLGYVEAVSGATAGQWASVSKIVNWVPGMPLPGDVVDEKWSYTGAAATGTTTTPKDDTIPQITEGNQFMTIAHTAKSALNFRDILALASCSQDAATDHCNIAIYQIGTSACIGCDEFAFGSAAQALGVGNITVTKQAGATSESTFTTRIGNGSAAIITLNGQASARLYGGSFASYMKVTEKHI